MAKLNKKCVRCEKLLPITRFSSYKTKSNGVVRQDHCKDCKVSRSEITKQSEDRRNNAKCKFCKVSLTDENWHASHRNKSNLSYRCKKCHAEASSRTGRDYKLRTMYGITKEDYDNILESQNNVCAICKEEDKVYHNRNGVNIKISMPVDHCHDTGKVRGLLCTSCNRAIGLLKDSIDNLKSAIKYLKKHNKEE